MADNVRQVADRGDARIAVSGLEAFYRESQVLHGVGLEIRRGELVSLLGNNGAGKTTTLRSIMGLVARRGSIRVGGVETVAMMPEQIARLGIGYVPEERGIFASLTVEENLLLPPRIGPNGMERADIYALFPNLRERRKSQGTMLSGGEQQMLAIARILRSGADVILLDEPTEGLAPVIVQQIGDVIRELKRNGLTILLVEQSFRFARTVADRHYIVEDGHVIDMIENEQLEDEAVLDRLSQYLGV